MTQTIRKRRAKRMALPDPHNPIFEMSETIALLEQAQEVNSRQIAEVSATTNKAITDLAQNTNRQFRDITVVLEKQGAQTNTRLESLVENFQSTQRPNWPVWIAGITLIVMLLTGAMWIISLSTENTVYKNLIPLQASLDANTARDQVSEKDRQKLNEGQESNRAMLEAVKSEQQVFAAKLSEVETQFKMSDRSHNIQFAENQRMNNILMQIAQGLGGKEHPLYYPQSPYYFPETTDGVNK